MLKFLSTLFSVIFSLSAFTQTLMLETRGKTVGYFIHVEGKLGSAAFKYRYSYIGKSGLAQPIHTEEKKTMSRTSWIATEYNLTKHHHLTMLRLFTVTNAIVVALVVDLTVLGIAAIIANDTAMFC